jgi:hypothetical protein
MANTIGIFDPLSAAFPTSNYPALLQDGQFRPYLAFDDTTDETCYWTSIAPQSITGTLNAIVKYRATSATSGTFLPVVAIEAITAGDALDTDASSSFDTDNTPSAVTVPATAGYEEEVVITLTNKDSMAAGDYYRLRLFRDVSGDTATGDIEVLMVELRDSV